MVLQRMGSVKVASATLVAALAVVFALTLMKGTYSFGGFWSTEAHRNRSIDLQLFDAWSNPTLWYAPWLDAVGNVALFIPFGFLLVTILAGRWRMPIVFSTLLGFLVSVGIEVAQYVYAIGYTDVDDVLCNTVGAFLGACFARILGCRGRGFVVTLFLVGALCILAEMVLSVVF
ncbi:VanZ family protein [Corynebacterium ulcerans]|nr:VanZ family protein [Corynebacterium ulcerans]AEG84987.1 putative membrane protein [Corynebacterium ulcerans BR-AD22]AIU92797.1 Glycopeptide antibiotics resistance protein [Corynebacterium ulcerans]KPH74023.1 antibiotic resistance protein [Corynebacterium ulcerans]MBH5302806.1 VanZ family protein [Corynebacterium ulcerans]MBL4944608.1 VanZ family protein [Corynebacterium ulcerans]